MSESEEKIITILSAEFTRTFLIALSTSCTQLNPDDTTFLKTFKSLTGIFLAIYWRLGIFLAIYWRLVIFLRIYYKLRIIFSDNLAHVS